MIIKQKLKVYFFFKTNIVDITDSQLAKELEFDLRKSQIEKRFVYESPFKSPFKAPTPVKSDKTFKTPFKTPVKTPFKTPTKTTPCTPLTPGSGVKVPKLNSEKENISKNLFNTTQVRSRKNHTRKRARVSTEKVIHLPSPDGKTAEPKKWTVKLPV